MLDEERKEKSYLLHGVEISLSKKWLCN